MTRRTVEEATGEEMQRANALPALFVNKSIINVLGDRLLVRLTFAEMINPGLPIIPRVAVMMVPQDLVALRDTINFILEKMGEPQGSSH